MRARLNSELMTLSMLAYFFDQEPDSERQNLICWTRPASKRALSFWRRTLA
jgi:hypothetical protein